MTSRPDRDPQAGGVHAHGEYTQPPGGGVTAPGQGTSGAPGISIITPPGLPSPAPLAEDEVDAYYRLLEPEILLDPIPTREGTPPAPPGTGDHGEGREGRFGWGRCTPSLLQPLSSIHLFTGLFLLLTFLSGLQGSYTIAVLTTLERAYNLPSSVSGTMVTVSSLGYMATVLFIWQLGRGRHIPKILTASTLGVVISAGLYVTPYVIYGTGRHGDVTHRNNDAIVHSSNNGELHTSTYSTDLTSSDVITQYCQDDVTSNMTSCGSSGDDVGDVSDYVTFNLVALALFVTAEIVSGVAGSPFWSLGLSFVDESVGKRLSSKILGLMYTIRFMSPVISFLLGAYFLSMYATLEDTSLTPEHPRWIGAWYMGYVICAAGGVLVLIPMSMLPKYLSHTPDNISEEKTSEKSVINKETENPGPSRFDNLRDIPKAIARLACNPVYLITVLGLMVDVFVVGYIIFLPKYFEVQFQMPAWRANIFGGMLPALAGGLASFISGQMASRVREGQTSASFCKMTVVCSTISALTLLACLGLGCHAPHIASPVNSNGLDDTSGFHGYCDISSNCSCRGDVFDPVCGGGELYMSPCHAGCPIPQPIYNNTLQNGTLTGCGCTVDGTVDRGLCEDDCFAFLAMFMVVTYTSVFLLNLYNVPVTNTCLRSVNKEDKTMAFAVLMFLCSFVSIPAPAIFGDLIDSTCLVHKVAPPCSGNAGQTGACLLYDKVAFKNKLFIVTVVIKGIATVLYVIPWLLAEHRERRAARRKGKGGKPGRDAGKEAGMYKGHVKEVGNAVEMQPLSGDKPVTSSAQKSRGASKSVLNSENLNISV